MPQPDAISGSRWRSFVFKNRGLLLVPVVLVLVSFGRPTTLSAVAGIAIALAGELLRIWAVGYSGVTTRADVVTAPRLVTAGPYSYVRNPLYVGNAITAFGFWVAFSGGVPLTLSALTLAFIALVIVAVYAAIIPLEESYLARTFGASYLDYQKRVPLIVPSGKALPLGERQGMWRAEVIFHAEVITLAFFALMVAAVGIKLHRG